MSPFAGAAGSWSGTNGFRLRPTDAFDERPATATLTVAAGGHLATLAYTWEHGSDGAQDGLLVVGPGEDDGTFVALWGDSWHQSPSPMTLTGAAEGDGVLLVASYAGDWGWRIALQAAAGALTLRMDNVVPASAATEAEPAGPYDCMAMSLTR